MKIEPCACMGPQGDDPVCPCMMQSRGLVPSNTWTKEDKQRLHEALDKIFFKRESKNDQSIQ